MPESGFESFTPSGDDGSLAAYQAPCSAVGARSFAWITMSPDRDGDGSANVAAERLTESNTAVLTAFGSWLVTARPARTSWERSNDTLTEPSVVQSVPSRDTNAVTIAPFRVSLNQPGA